MQTPLVTYLRDICQITEFSAKYQPNSIGHLFIHIETLSKKLCEKARFWPNVGIRQSVAFVVFVAFWGTTMLFFKKLKIRAFRKVYGLWGYSLPIKTYVRLKFG